MELLLEGLTMAAKFAFKKAVHGNLDEILPLVN
jgi:hypothetical protein